MPSLPNEIGMAKGKPITEYEFMESIAYLNRKTHMSHSEIMGLSYAIFLSYLKQNQLMDLRETSEGREHLAKIERLNTTTADVQGLRRMTGYKKKGGE